MKLPNGYGSIYKKGGNRRKPYVVIVTTGWNDDGKQKRKVLGYVTSPALGLKMLSEYHDSPYDLNYKNLTFAEIWSEVEKQLEKLIEANRMSDNNLRCLRNAYKNHLQPLHNDIILDIKKRKMQEIINNINGGTTLKGNAKTVCVKVFNYAIDELELPIKSNPAIRLDVGSKVKSDKHTPYTKEEESILWGMQHIDLVKIIIIMNYTGTRPNELFKAKKENIFIESDYFVSGSKTEAGRDRVIPIHPKIKHLFKYFYDNGGDYPFKSIFDKFTYSKFSRETTKLFNKLGFNHTPYDSRHTFTTKMKKAGVNEYVLKRIIGHSIKDVTEEVYTHRDITELINEVKKID